ncbi:dihydrodipicolinate reductase [Rhodococcus sp. NPDC058514]|uniref:NAD(P)H-dependent amine dehydrogenase family protein n=1 Tax=unclassified Rhodococcus (in: high G+C Gram-positive bacteria) TaxID=192944 RepID=UPI00365E4957
MISTIVWGSGGIARDAIRAVDADPALELTAVLASDPDQVGRDAGDFAGLDRPLGVTVTADSGAVLACRPRAVVYAGSGTTRSVDARADVLAALHTGAVVVTPPIAPLYDHRGSRPEVGAPLRAAVAAGGGSLVVCDVDPDWADHVLPLVLGGLDAGATTIRCREIVDYSGYDLPGSVRYLMGMGEPLSYLPPMLAPCMPTMVWGDRVRLLARALGVELDEIRETMERVPLEVTVETDLMGKFESGGQGAVRFEVQGVVDGSPRIVIEHVGRVHPDCAPDWPTAPAPEPGRPGGSAHWILVEGAARVEATVEPGTEDGASSAVTRLVGAIAWVAGQESGLYDALDLARRSRVGPND